MASKKYAVPDKERCVSCGACAAECPRDAISIWRGCYAVVDASVCVGCGLCQRACPANCIELKQREGTE